MLEIVWRNPYPPLPPEEEEPIGGGLFLVRRDYDDDPTPAETEPDTPAVQ